jgi:hypothetical protein
MRERRALGPALVVALAVNMLLWLAVPSLAAGADNGQGKTATSKGAEHSHAGGNEKGHGSQPNGASDHGKQSAGSTPKGKGDGPTSGVGGANCDGSQNSDTGHGANQGGPYDNTCPSDEGPAPNGNGGGKASGKPCAGCVGNADDKNPGAASGKGQYPNGSDHNAGYECDRNNGVGKGNPAHTGCDPDNPPPHDECPNIPGNQPPGTDCDPDNPPPHDECPDIPGNQPPGTECEEEPPGHRPPPDGDEPKSPDEVLGIVIHRRPGTEVRPAALPFTGGNLLPFVLTSIVMIGAGAAAMVGRRPKS